MKKFYITTPIYYASGRPHLGHAYTTVLADIFKRYKTLFGYETFLTTGMDEHGQKIADKAKSLGLDPQTFVDQNCAVFLDLWKKLDISYDSFIRTSSKQHEKVVQSVFSDYLKKGYIKLDKWTGYYCVQCEQNYTEKELTRKDDGSLYCWIGHPIELKEEESYFYDVKKDVPWLKNYFKEHPNFIIPQHRITELENNFLDDLTDLSVSRVSTTWGVPVLENNQHVLYVWLDALFCYLTALGFRMPDDKNYLTFWADKDAERVHLMSREIIRFHCIYWPIFLKDLDLNEPTKIVSHGWIITKEGKMSKSLGNVVDPFELVEKYSADALRFFIAKELAIYKDGVFSEDSYVEIINADLSNNIGNLVSRTIGMLKKYTDYVVPEFVSNVNEQDKEFETLIFQVVDHVRDYVTDFKLEKAMVEIINLVKFANKYIEDNKPWELNKNQETKKLNSLLNHLALTIYVITYLLQPVLTEGTKEIIKQMNLDFNNIKAYDDLKNYHLVDHLKVNESTPIFTRYELKKA